jgi:hypothetical protein
MLFEHVFGKPGNDVDSYRATSSTRPYTDVQVLMITILTYRTCTQQALNQSTASSLAAELCHSSTTSVISIALRYMRRN